ncbi:MAG: thiol:disulfide interchange protein DsbA/DsbL [Gammaproteobacteria bacterium WSBS_2016_MAG_OTU1]
MKNTLPHRSFFSRLLLMAATVAFAVPSIAQESSVDNLTVDDLVAGRDYILLNPPQAVRAPKGKIELLEFFNFSCPHCYRLQGPFKRWQDNTDLSDVEIIHQPVVFQSQRGIYARLFHTIEGLGVTDTLYDEVFNTLHKQRKLLNSKGRIVDWLEENGVDAEKAEKTFDSFSTNTKVSRDSRITDSYGVNSTPQLAVAGKYLLTPGLSGSTAAMLKIAELLIDLERKEMKK